MESYPRVTLEAMSFGLPIISTPVNGVMEQIFHNINGKLYPPNNIQSLAMEIVNMVGSQEIRNNFSKNTTLVFSSMITHEQMLNKYGKVFQECWISGESR